MSPYQLVFHPLTGLCITRQSLLLWEPLKLGPCTDSGAAWIYTTDRNLQVKGSSLCVTAIGQGQGVKLGMFCSEACSKWEPVSASGLHLASHASDDTFMHCLDVDGKGNIITNPCQCLDKRDRECDPASQWFSIVTTTRDPAAASDHDVLVAAATAEAPRDLNATVSLTDS